MGGGIQTVVAFLGRKESGMTEAFEKPKCGFDEKEPCTRKCIYYDTCTRNPNKKRKNSEKSLH